jgi:hypothetical protein
MVTNSGQTINKEENLQIQLRYWRVLTSVSTISLLSGKHGIRISAGLQRFSASIRWRSPCDDTMRWISKFHSLEKGVLSTCSCIGDFFQPGDVSMWGRVSSGSIVSDYGLDDRAVGVRYSAGVKDFSSSLCVQTGSGAHPASCPVGTGGPFPGGKARPGRDANHSTRLVPRSWMSRSYISSPPKRLHGV